jgi:hypothetical protein
MAFFGHSNQNQVASSNFPLSKWLNATTTNALSASSLSAFFGVARDANKPCIFELENQGKSIAILGRDSAAGQIGKLCHAYWNGTTIDINLQTLASGSNFKWVQQYVNNKNKLLAVLGDGTFCEFDFTSVLNAGGNATKTVLIADVEDVAQMGAPFAQNDNFCFKWIGDNDDKILTFFRDGTLLRVTNYKKTSGTWALVNAVNVTGLNNITCNDAICNWKQRDFAGLHYFFSGSRSNGRYGVKVSLDANLNITINYSIQDTTAYTALYYLEDSLLGNGAANTYTGFNLLDTGSALVIPSDYNNIQTIYQGCRPFSPDNSVMGSFHTIVTNYLGLNFAKFGIFPRSGGVLQLTSGYNPNGNMGLFTSDPALPFKYLWGLSDNSTDSYIALAQIT